MSLFVLDSTGDKDLLNKNVAQSSRTYKKFIDKVLTGTSVDNLEKNEQLEEEDNEGITEDEFFGLPPPDIDISDIIDATLAITYRKPSEIEEEIDLYLERLRDIFKNNTRRKPKHKRYICNIDPTLVNELFAPTTGESLIKTNVEKVMETSNIPLGLEKLKGLPMLNKRQELKLKKIERSKTKGNGWFDMPAPEITEEIENDLKILKMRSVLDPKHFYKKNDLKVLPKYFQIGTVQHSPLDYYNERHTRKNKKRSMVDELLEDNHTQEYTKRKYKEVLEQTRNYAHRKNAKKMKKLKKKNK